MRHAFGLVTLILIGALAGCGGGGDPVDLDGDGATAEDDCDDFDPGVHPGAPELCDGLDDDCDGALGPSEADADGDGYTLCEADCDDGDPAAHPGGVEVCNGHDDDCDGMTDEDAVDLRSWYVDADHDGWGAGALQTGCARPAMGVAPLAGDCDDAAPSTHPGAAEDCDPIDRNCDGSGDAGAVDALAWYADADHDGWGAGAAAIACTRPDGSSLLPGDCDDVAAATHPGATEYCDAADRDCDGAAEAGAVDALTWYADADHDGWGTGAAQRGCVRPANTAILVGDCNDAVATTYPGATELCDGADRDCDGSPTNGAVDAGTWYTDGDGDGWGTGTAITACLRPAGAAALVGDCNDAVATTHPGAPELCDAVDRDCDGAATAGAIDALTWYTDADHDGWGTGNATIGCVRPAGTAVVVGDCDDGAIVVHPGAAELCDAIDRDCNGDPVAGAVDARRYFADADGDGFGDAAVELWACTPPPASTLDATDCDDAHATAWPGSTAIETPGDGIDNDCDGIDACTDLNCDGVPDVAVPSHHDGDYNILQPARILSGPGGWALEPTALPMTGVLGSAVADLDHDGYQDIVHASYYNGGSYAISSHIYWGSAAGQSDFDRTDLPTTGAYWPCIGDLNNDGWEDVVFADQYDGDYSTDSYVYWNNNGTFQPGNRTALPTTGPAYCLITDVNGDTFPELLFASSYDGDYATNSNIYWGSPTGVAAGNRTDLPTFGSQSVTADDVDSDGDVDLIFWSHYNGSSHVNSTTFIYWNAFGTFGIGNRTALDSMGGYRGAVADLNGDGFKDVVASGYYNNAWGNMASTYIYWGNANHVYGNGSRTALSLKGVLTTLVDDINEDGHLDLLLGSNYDGDSYAPSAIFWGQVGGTFSDVARTELPGYQVNFGTAVRDFDRDGFKDVFLPGYHNNGWQNQSYSRIYWGRPGGPQPATYAEWTTRGTWSAVVVGK